MPASNAVSTHNSRMSLSEAILSEIKSWPDLHRNLFVQSHYFGKSPEQLSLSADMRPAEIRSILDQCARKLRAALRSHRAVSLDSDPSMCLSAQPHVPGSYLF